MEVRTNDGCGFMQSKTYLTRADVETRLEAFKRMLEAFPNGQEWVMTAEHYPATKDKPAMDFLVLRELEK